MALREQNSLSDIFAPDPRINRQGQQLIFDLQQQLGGLDGLPGPTQEQVPQSVNPFAAMGSTFAASLAGQLGAREAPRQNFLRLQQQEAKVRAAENRNAQAQISHDLAREKQRLELQDQIGEVKQQRLKQAGDLVNLEKEAKAEERRDKMKFANREKLETIRAQSRAEVARIQRQGRREVATIRNQLKKGASPEQKRLLDLIFASFNNRVRLAQAEIQSFVPGAGLDDETYNALLQEAASQMIGVRQGTFDPQSFGQGTQPTAPLEGF